jgi:hypothetical protein
MLKFRFNISKLLTALEFGHIKVAETLIKAGADINILAPNGRSPLMIGKIIFVQLVLLFRILIIFLIATRDLGDQDLINALIEAGAH